MAMRRTGDMLLWWGREIWLLVVGMKGGRKYLYTGWSECWVCSLQQMVRVVSAVQEEDIE